MFIEEKIEAILTADPGITALVPASSIKVPGNLQGFPTPYITHFPVTLETTDTHDQGSVNLKIWKRYQVSCFGSAYSDTKRVAAAVTNALKSYRSGGIVCNWVSEILLPYAPDERITHIAIEFEIADSL